jgi:hypothetical protein
VPKLRAGAVASGSKVVDNAEYALFASVHASWPKLLAVEMERLGWGSGDGCMGPGVRPGGRRRRAPRPRSGPAQVGGRDGNGLFRVDTIFVTARFRPESAR